MADAHVPTIERADAGRYGNGGWRGACSCGWHGDVHAVDTRAEFEWPKDRISRAQEDALRHARERG